MAAWKLRAKKVASCSKRDGRSYVQSQLSTLLVPLACFDSNAFYLFIFKIYF